VNACRCRMRRTSWAIWRRHLINCSSAWISRSSGNAGSCRRVARITHAAAILRGEAEVALSRSERSAARIRESLGRAARRGATAYANCRRFIHFDACRRRPVSTVSARLLLRRTGADCTHTTRSLALAKQITLTCEVPEELLVRGDEALLRRMILNLLDNCHQYTPSGGRVAVSCERAGNEYALSVTDTGAGDTLGVPAEGVRAVFPRR